MLPIFTTAFKRNPCRMNYRVLGIPNQIIFSKKDTRERRKSYIQSWCFEFLYLGKEREAKHSEFLPYCIASFSPQDNSVK